MPLTPDEILNLFDLPVDEEDLLRAIVSANVKGFIRTEFRRVVVSMPFGSTVTNTVNVTPGRIFKVIGTDNTMLDIHDQAITVTLTIDNHTNVYDEIPMTHNLSVDSIYFPFIFDKIEYTLDNQGASNAVFTEDLQLLSIDKSFFDRILKPTFSGQFRQIRNFSSELQQPSTAIETTGGGS